MTYSVYPTEGFMFFFLNFDSLCEVVTTSSKAFQIFSCVHSLGSLGSPRKTVNGICNAIHEF